MLILLTQSSISVGLIDYWAGRFELWTPVKTSLQLLLLFGSELLLHPILEGIIIRVMPESLLPNKCLLSIFMLQWIWWEWIIIIIDHKYNNKLLLILQSLQDQLSRLSLLLLLHQLQLHLRPPSLWHLLLSLFFRHHHLPRSCLMPAVVTWGHLRIIILINTERRTVINITETTEITFSRIPSISISSLN